MKIEMIIHCDNDDEVRRIYDVFRHDGFLVEKNPPAVLITLENPSPPEVVGERCYMPAPDPALSAQLEDVFNELKAMGL